MDPELIKTLGVTLLEAPREDEEREAYMSLEDKFYIRHPPPPDELGDFQTDEDSLFQTIHMGAAEVDQEKWMLVVSGLVERPFAITLSQLRKLPSKTVTSFHECYGSPLVPPTKALRRIGNVEWRGVALKTLLDVARPRPDASFIWSEGLDRGQFAKVEADRYQKDLPMEKALRPEVLIAYAMNSKPLGKNRGGPVRLVVPGWFGTNSTKWLSKISVQDRRAPGPFTTTFYNENHPPDYPECESKPIWEVQPNSMIVSPAPDSKLSGPKISVEGWAWSDGSVEGVKVSVDEGETWNKAELERRKDFSWQRYRVVLQLNKGPYTILAQASSPDGRRQPLGEGRNHVHRVTVEVV